MSGAPPHVERLAERQRQGPRAVCLADVEPEPVKFLWKPYIPLGKVTLLDGDPGQGKSYLTASLAASLSKGEPLPEEMVRREPCKTLLLSAEDGLADTLRPRLDGLGANPRFVFAYPGPVDLSTEPGRETLAKLMERHRPALVVVDPIVCYLGVGVDMHRANEVRGVMAPLAALAAEYRCAVLAVRHLTKARAGRALHSGLGSVDFVAGARSVLLAGSSADDPPERALLHIKSNLAAPGPALSYALDGGFRWCGKSGLTETDLLKAAPETESAPARREAEEFLRAVLAAGPVPSKEVKLVATEEGISESALRRAKEALGVVSQREGFGPSGRFLWTLPEALEAVGE